MQNESWMQPALQAGEAVLLPALERQSNERFRYNNLQLPSSRTEAAFQPASTLWEEQLSAQTHAISRQGSMAGRSVLRAAGVKTAPMAKRCRRCR